MHQDPPSSPSHQDSLRQLPSEPTTMDLWEGRGILHACLNQAVIDVFVTRLEGTQSDFSSFLATLEELVLLVRVAGIVRYVNARDVGPCLAFSLPTVWHGCSRRRTERREWIFPRRPLRRTVVRVMHILPTVPEGISVRVAHVHMVGQIEVSLALAQIPARAGVMMVAT
jgi:hypothetical protein